MENLNMRDFITGILVGFGFATILYKFVFPKPASFEVR